jgi:hypothetical protein
MLQKKLGYFVFLTQIGGSHRQNHLRQDIPIPHITLVGFLARNDFYTLNYFLNFVRIIVNKSQNGVALDGVLS